MNSKQVYFENIWAARRSLIDLIVMEHFNVSDSTGIAGMIEDMPGSNIQKIFEKISILDDKQGKELLEAIYAEYNSKKTSAIVVNESTWQSQRNQVLLNEDSDKRNGMSADEIEHVILTSSVATIIPILMVQYFKPGGPRRINAALERVKRKSSSTYHTVRNALRAKGIKILPDPAPHIKLAKGLLKAEPATPHLKQWKIDMLGDKFSITKFLGKSAATILVAVGLTYLILFLHKTFNKLNREALRKCKGKGNERKKCMLTYKIQACEIAIQKLQEAIPACEKKNNPQKCKLSLQKEIWMWTKRKGKYQDELQKLGQIKIPKAFG